MRQTVADPALNDEPLAALKDWLAITGTRDDALLGDCLKAAAALCERFTGLVPLTTTYRETFAASAPIFTPSTRPVRRVVAMSALDGEAERVLPPEAYTAAIAADGTLGVRLTEGLAETRVAVSYEAGQAGAWATLDPPLRHGILRHAAHLYRERDSGREDAVPAAVAALWRPYRQVRL